MRHRLVRTLVPFALATVAALGVPGAADNVEGFYSGCFGTASFDLAEVDPASAGHHYATVRYNGGAAVDVLEDATWLPHADWRDSSTIHVTAHCWVQFGNAVPNIASAQPSSHCVFESTAVANVWAEGMFHEYIDTGAAAGVCAVEFDVPPPPYAPLDDTYLCAETTFSHDGGSQTYFYDGDRNPANGDQCKGFYEAEVGIGRT